MIAQEPLRIEFRRIGVSSRVVQNLPIQSNQLAEAGTGGKELRRESFSFLSFTHQMFENTVDPLGMKCPS